MESAELTQSNNHLWEKILIVILFYLVIAFVSNELILTEEMYFDFYDGQIEADKVDSVIHKTRNFNIIKAIWEPFSHLLSVLGVTFCLVIGCLYYNYKIKFKQLFNEVLGSYFIFFVPTVIKFLYFLIVSDLSMKEYNNYYFGSLLFLTSIEDPFWLKSILQVFTLFELIFWVLLSYRLSKMFICDFDRSFKLVLISYVVGLALWVAVRIYVKMMLFNLT
jgi:hypothetical protein